MYLQAVSLNTDERVGGWSYMCVLHQTRVGSDPCGSDSAGVVFEVITRDFWLQRKEVSNSHGINLCINQDALTLSTVAAKCLPKTSFLASSVFALCLIAVAAWRTHGVSLQRLAHTSLDRSTAACLWQLCTVIWTAFSTRAHSMTLQALSQRWYIFKTTLLNSMVHGWGTFLSEVALNLLIGSSFPFICWLPCPDIYLVCLFKSFVLDALTISNVLGRILIL